MRISYRKRPCPRGSTKSDRTSQCIVGAVAVKSRVRSSVFFLVFRVLASVTLALTPSSVDLAAAQSQMFAATVAGSSNTTVTGSPSTAVGSFSAGGLYPAPVSIISAQTTMTATSVASSLRATSPTVLLSPPKSTASTYYLSPTGSDSNNGTSSTTPWLTPNHVINCGDVIIASASTSYSARNFASGKWGTVTCPTGNNVAWLKCTSFDACKISVTSGTLDGMRVSASYWGVQGWEVSNAAGGRAGGSCFTAVPATQTVTIHHIIFANDIANVCPLGGFGSGPYGNASVDYFVVVGNIAYGAGTSNTYCGSGISAYEPVASDSLKGTHIYVAGNFSFSNINPSGCYDGNGIIFDTFDGDQTSIPSPYSQQGVIDNNITVSNGGVGVRVEYNNAGAGPNHAHIYVRHNTMWNNSIASNQRGNPSCGELQLYKTENTEVFLNLASTNQRGCYGNISHPEYAYSVDHADSSSVVYQNVGWSPAGFYSQSTTSTGFSFGSNNLFGTNPALANPMTPGPPKCQSYLSVTSCMQTVIANFAPATTSAAGYGYGVPNPHQIYDALFPQWLCNVNLPAGLVTMGCLNGSSSSETPPR
jgi:hypothetical protein